MKNNKKLNETILNEIYLEISYKRGHLGHDGHLVSTGGCETPLRGYIEVGSKGGQSGQGDQETSFKKYAFFITFYLEKVELSKINYQDNTTNTTKNRITIKNPTSYPVRIRIS